MTRDPNTYEYGWADYSVRIVTDITSLEHSFDMQSWCIATLGDRWATTPPGVDTQEWYFVDEADALLFRLRWGPF
jgi:hypothetical protein